ncbi:MAG: M16 family metallopeptidase [Planctomycetota bacterium]
MRRAAIAFLLLVTSATAASGADSVVLDNGLTLLVDRRPSAPAVAAVAFVRGGRRHEPRGLAGAAHMTEHMLFRATGRRPEGGLEREAWRVGARLRASTHEDFVRVGMGVPSERLDLALDLIADMLTSARFLLGEVEEERRVILDEIAKRNADAEGWAWEELTGMTFLPHPYGARLAGTLRSVAAISRDDLFEFYRRYYRPDRTVLVLTGDIDPDEALAKVRRWFGAWSPAGGATAEPAPPPAEFGRYQEMTVTREGASPLLLVSATLPGYLHPDYMPTRFLKELVAGWVSRPLVTEDGLAVATDVYFSSLVDRNVLRIRIQLDDPGEAAEARDALLSLLRELRGPRVRFAGVEAVAENLRSRAIMLGEDLWGLAGVIGRAALSGYYEGRGPPEHLAAPDRYRRVTEADVGRVARSYLTPANLRVLFLLPPGTEPPDPPRLSGETGAGRHPDAGEVARMVVEPATAAAVRAPPVRDGDATRAALPGGTVFLHLERPASPVVAGSLVYHAGSSTDAERPGRAALTMQALALDTEGHEGGQLRWRLFEMGNRWDFSVERDTARVGFVVPKEHARDALMTTVEMLAKPAFSAEAIAEARGRLLKVAVREREQVSSFAAREFRLRTLAKGYAFAPHGEEAPLGRLGKGDLEAFHRERLSGAPVAVAIVGGISRREADALVREALEGVERGSEVAKPRAEPPAPEKRTVGLTHPSGRGYAILGGPAPSLGDPAFPATSLLRLALGWLVFDEFTNVRSDAYEAGSFHLAYRDGGAFGIHVGASPEKIPEIRDVLLDRLRVVREQGLPEALVEDAKGAWLGGAVLISARSDQVATRLAYREALGLGHASFDSLREAIEKLEPADLRALCRRLLAPARLTTVLVGN